MEKVKKVLYFYSLVISIIIPVAIIAINHTPTGITLLILSLPLPLYFIAHLKNTIPNHSDTIGAKTAIPSLAMLLLFVLLWPKLIPVASSNQQTAPSKPDTASVMDGKIIESLGEIKDEIVKIRAEQQSLDQVLGSTDTSVISELINNIPEENLPSSTPAAGARGKLTIANPKWQKIDIYKEPLASSRIIGKIEYGNLIDYLTKEGSWYQVKQDTVSGWVKAELVKEIQ